MSDDPSASHEQGALGEGMPAGRRARIVHVRPGYHEGPRHPNRPHTEEATRPRKRPIPPKKET
jgi:hypothetical protein